MIHMVVTHFQGNVGAELPKSVCVIFFFNIFFFIKGKSVAEFTVEERGRHFFFYVLFSGQAGGGVHCGRGQSMCPSVCN